MNPGEQSHFQCKCNVSTVNGTLVASQRHSDLIIVNIVQTDLRPNWRCTRCWILNWRRNCHCGTTTGFVCSCRCTCCRMNMFRSIYTDHTQCYRGSLSRTKMNIHITYCCPNPLSPVVKCCHALCHERQVSLLTCRLPINDASSLKMICGIHIIRTDRSFSSMVHSFWVNFPLFQ